MVQVCERQRTKLQMLEHSLEQYREVFVRARNNFARVIDVSLILPYPRTSEALNTVLPPIQAVGTYVRGAGDAGANIDAGGDDTGGGGGGGPGRGRGSRRGRGSGGDGGRGQPRGRGGPGPRGRGGGSTRVSDDDLSSGTCIPSYLKAYILSQFLAR